MGRWSYSSHSPEQAQYLRARLPTRRARFITTSIHVMLHNASLCVPLSPRMNYDFVMSAYAWERTHLYSFAYTLCTLEPWSTRCHWFLIMNIYILVNHTLYKSLTPKKSYILNLVVVSGRPYIFDSIKILAKLM